MVSVWTCPVQPTSRLFYPIIHFYACVVRGNRFLNPAYTSNVVLPSSEARLHSTKTILVCWWCRIKTKQSLGRVARSFHPRVQLRVADFSWHHARMVEFTKIASVLYKHLPSTCIALTKKTVWQRKFSLPACVECTWNFKKLKKFFFCLGGVCNMQNISEFLKD